MGSFVNTVDGCGNCAEIETITFAPTTLSSYVKGGVNTLSIGSSTCEGIYNNGGLLATVDVTYVSPPPPPSIPTNGLLVRWELNDGAGTTAADASGNGRSGTLSNATWETSGCELATCLRFTGTGGAGGLYVSYANSLPFSSPGTGASFAAWVNLDSSGTGTYQTLFNGPYTSCCTYRLLVDPNLHPFWDSGAYSDQDLTGYTFTLGQWTHVAWTIQAGGAATLYINGAQVLQTTAGVPGSLPDMPNLDVGTADSYQWPAKGLFNDVLIYDRVLSPAEVTSIYQSY